ncbi:MAG: hypothetical protein K940chlam9_00789 [Chlamydiae bacterium]|nr:hypothetical protein [Chlamydiota bacterium]
MKRIGLLLLLVLGFSTSTLSAWVCGCRCVERYTTYSPSEVDYLYYGYQDFYTYPYGYALPVNYTFNYCSPCSCTEIYCVRCPCCNGVQYTYEAPRYIHYSNY